MTVLYSKVRHEIQTGDLLAWRTTKINSFISLVLFLYQKIFKAKFSHVGVAVRVADRIFIVEAVPPVVHVVPLSQEGTFYWIPAGMTNTAGERFTQLPLGADEGAMIQHLLSTVGKPYSLVDFFKGLLKLGNSVSDYYCSEQAGEFYNSFGRLTNEDAGDHPDRLVDELVKAVGIEPIEVFMDKGNIA